MRPDRHGGPSRVAGRRISMLGLMIDAVDLPQAVMAIDAALARRERGYMVTPNADHVVRHHRDPAFRAAYCDAALCVPDGMPLVWASRLLGRPLSSRVAGADLLPALCEMASARGHTVFILGGRGEVAHRAAANLAVRAPGLAIVGTHTPPEGFARDHRAMEAAVDAVNQATPDLLFIGLGAPAQELWVHRYWDRLATTVAVCCGAALDYAAGTKPRAPQWMQRTGLEWLWRLLHEPRRLWRRYLVEDAAFVGIVLKEWVRLRIRKSG